MLKKAVLVLILAVLIQNPTSIPVDTTVNCGLILNDFYLENIQPTNNSDHIMLSIRDLENEKILNYIYVVSTGKLQSVQSTDQILYPNQSIDQIKLYEASHYNLSTELKRPDLSCSSRLVKWTNMELIHLNTTLKWYESGFMDGVNNRLVIKRPFTSDEINSDTINRLGFGALSIYSLSGGD